MLIARPPSCALTVRRSQLYSSATETKFVDESLRLSSFRAIKSEPLFQLCDTLLDEVNKQAGEDFHFTLVRSDATQIKYSAGGANTPSAQPGSAAAARPPSKFVRRDTDISFTHSFTHSDPLKPPKVSESGRRPCIVPIDATPLSEIVFRSACLLTPRAGFFKRHKDFLSVTSNVVEEYTLLVCITPEKLAAEVKGGGTVIHALGSSTKYSATTTPGEALLFRKGAYPSGLLATPSR